MPSAGLRDRQPDAFAGVLDLVVEVREQEVLAVEPVVKLDVEAVEGLALAMWAVGVGGGGHAADGGLQVFDAAFQQLPVGGVVVLQRPA